MHIVNECNFPVAWVLGKINPPAYSATCIVKGTFRLLHEEKAQPMEEQDSPLGDLFVDNDIEKSCIYESDFACFKPRTDLVLSGNCYSPEAQSVQKCRVIFQVGELKKVLYITGNRYWGKNTKGATIISDPEPFTEMPLIYENSFGGSGFANNPHGKGIGKVTDDGGQECWPLPNIEDPDQPILAQDDRPHPAGFCPLGRMWPSRMDHKMGTYDDHWLKERWPYFPADFDWSYFNCAPLEMQMNKYLSGNETLYFENLHPDISHFHTQLAGLKARIFINKSNGNATQFHEIPLNIDTLWVDPGREKLNLVWRGVIEVYTEDMEEIEHCLVVCESMNDEPKPAEFYEALLQQRLQGDQEGLENTEPIIEIESSDESWIKDMEKDFVRLEDEVKKIKDQAAKSNKAIEGILRQAELTPVFLKRSQETAKNLPLKEIFSLAAKEELLFKKENPELAGKLPASLTPEEIEEIDESFNFDPFLGFDPFPEPLTRKDCVTLISTTKEFQDKDLSDLDLTGLDFSCCNCSNTIFSRAILHGAKFSAANLTGAIFAECELNYLNFKGANLTNADLTQASLISTTLDAALIDNADFSKGILENASFIDVNGFRSIFVGAELKGATFVGAQLMEADFEAANLELTDFTRANLQEASVEGVRGQGITMQSANLTGLHASEGPDFTNGNFREVIAPESIWEDAVLDRANFTMAHLVNADFTKTSLRHALFDGANLSMAGFDKADLTEAVMTYVNLFQGSFEQARLFRTDIRRANCYEVEFYRAEIDGARFDGSNLKMTKLAKKEE